MGLLRNTKVYLAGPIEYAGDGKGGVIWRDKITEILQDMGVRVYDPMKKPHWYPRIAKGNPGVYVKEVLEGVKEVVNSDDASERDHALNDEMRRVKIEASFEAIKFIEKVDFRYVNDCEWLIVYLPAQRTYGTIDELRCAVNAGKPIFIFSEEIIPSSWIMGMAGTPDNFHEVFFPDMDKLVEHIRRIDNGEVELDPAKWIFLTYWNQNLPLKPRETWSVK